MATTYGFFADSGLTTPATSKQFDQADVAPVPDVDSVWFGSATAARVAKAASNPGVAQITVTPVSALTVWTATTVKSLGAIVQPTVANGRRYRATIAGTTGASQPTWPTTVGQTVVDGTVTWICEKAHLPAEFELSLNGTAYNAGGAALNLGVQVLSGAAAAVRVYMRCTDATAVVANQTDVNLTTNTINEYAQ